MAPYGVLFHHRAVRRRAAECDGSEHQKERGELADHAYRNSRMNP